MSAPAEDMARTLAAFERGDETFMGLKLRVAPGVLVPRTETELLGRAAVKLIETMRAERGDEPIRIIDMCCGSGNLACGLAAAVPNARVWASDLTGPCVELTRQNVNDHNLGERVRVFQGDLFTPLANEGLLGRTDVVVCNPPYIPTATWATRDDLKHEPREAFDGGPFGLSVLMKVLDESRNYLRPGGGLFVEVGPREERHARQLFARVPGYTDIDVIRDATGVVRVVHARRAATP